MKKSIKLGSYIVEKENDYLKVSHENKSWNFRLSATQENIAAFFEDNKEDDWRKYFEQTFAATQIFTILAMQNPQYMQAWIKFHNSYFDELSKEAPAESDDQIIENEKALYEMKEAAKQEINENAEIITETTKTAE